MTRTFSHIAFVQFINKRDIKVCLRVPSHSLIKPLNDDGVRMDSGPILSITIDIVLNVDVMCDHTFRVGLICEFLAINIKGANNGNVCIKDFYNGKKLPPVGLITGSRI